MPRRSPHLRASASNFGAPELNLTPLIDVVFVVLISFIIIAPLLELEHIALAAGAHSRPLQAHERSRLHLQIRADNAICINDRPIAEANLVAVLRHWRQQLGSAPPQLFCDRRAHFGTYQALKCALEESGFAAVDLVVTPRSSPPPA